MPFEATRSADGDQHNIDLSTAFEQQDVVS